MITVDDIELDDVLVKESMASLSVRIGDDPVDDEIDLECPIANGYILEPKTPMLSDSRKWLRQLNRKEYRRFFELAARACAAYIIDDYLYFYRPLPQQSHRFILELIEKCKSGGLTEDQIAERFYLSPAEFERLKRSADGFDATLVNNICDLDRDRLSYRDFSMSEYTPPKELPEPAASLTAEAAKRYQYDGDDKKRAREVVGAHAAALPAVAQAADQLLGYIWARKQKRMAWYENDWH